MNNIVTSEQDIINRITSTYSIEEVVDLAGLKEADTIRYLIEQLEIPLSRFPDVLTEADYAESREESLNLNEEEVE